MAQIAWIHSLEGSLAQHIIILHYHATQKWEKDHSSVPEKILSKKSQESIPGKDWQKTSVSTQQSL
jgi:hypothetical protein